MGSMTRRIKRNIGVPKLSVQIKNDRIKKRDAKKKEEFERMKEQLATQSKHREQIIEL